MHRSSCTDWSVSVTARGIYSVELDFHEWHSARAWKISQWLASSEWAPDVRVFSVACFCVNKQEELTLICGLRADCWTLIFWAQTHSLCEEILLLASDVHVKRFKCAKELHTDCKGVLKGDKLEELDPLIILIVMSSAASCHVETHMMFCTWLAVCFCFFIFISFSFLTSYDLVITLASQSPISAQTCLHTVLTIKMLIVN